MSVREMQFDNFRIEIKRDIVKEYRDAGFRRRQIFLKNTKEEDMILCNWDNVGKNLPCQQRVNNLRKYFDDNSWIVMCGITGGGKTFLASMLGREYIDKNKSVVYGTAKELLDEVYAEEKDGRSEFRVKIKKCDLLIVDEMEKVTVTDAYRANWFSIFNYRFDEEKKTVIVSNMSYEMLFTEVLDDKFQRRVEENGIIAEFKEEKNG